MFSGLMLRKMIYRALLSGALAVLAACGAMNPPNFSEGHLSGSTADAANIPEPVRRAPALPRPVQRPDLETYTVIVNQVPVRELLFSMARDAKLNLDIDSDITGTVTMNAIDQTLPKILDRLTRQVAINYQLEDDTLHVRADKPYLKIYSVDYLNMSRTSTGEVTVSTEISSTGGGVDGQGGGGGNDSSSLVKNTSTNEFWKTLATNIGGIISEDVKTSSGDSVPVSKNIIINRESGIIAVRATFRQHEQIREFVDRVVGSAQRQVLIEATIAEVTLSDRYQAGIDWSMVSNTDPTERASQSLLGGNLGQAPFFSLALSGTVEGDPLNVTLRALETFGDVKILSSPKVMAINNQTAMLKVVDNEVYFTVEAEVTEVTNASGGVSQLAVLETQLNTVPVGFVMSVTPFIDDKDVVTLNVRPTISRIVSRVEDPNPDLKDAGVVSEIPVIQVREIESVLKINNGDTAVIGGLMQDQVNKLNTGVPILSSIPLIGRLFSYQDDEYIKSELVIFIRPVVAHNASLDGDLKDYRKYLLDDLRP